jgi:HAD superfamily hydrolase (TIGR01509 family)
MSAYLAVVFDMDGVLVDTEPSFHEALNEVLAPTGKRIEWEPYKKFLGTSTSVTWRGVMAELGLDLDGRDYVERYNETLVEVLARPKPLLPGVASLIERLRAQSKPIAVATSSNRAWLEAVFRGASLPLETFDALVSREMVERSKPAPDLYLRAAELLGVAPARCVAIEDTPPGIASAKAAGMYAIQTRSASSALPPIADADLVLDSLESFPLEIVQRER